MAKVRVLGDAIQLKTELTKEDLDRVKAFAPESLKLYDQDGNEVFGVDEGDAFYSKYGVCFSNTDSEGRLFMTSDNPVEDHSDPEKEKEEIIKHFAQILNKLEAIEMSVRNARQALMEIEESVKTSVEIVAE